MEDWRSAAIPLTLYKDVIGGIEMGQLMAMRRRRFLACLVTTIVVSVGDTHAQLGSTPSLPAVSRGPFGLIWGMGVERLASVGMEDRTNVGDSAHDGVIRRMFPRIIHLERVPRDTRYLDVHFGYRNQLYQVYAEGAAEELDDSTKRYRDLSILLTEVYGSGSEDVPSRKWFGSTEHGAILRTTTFTTPDLEIQLSIRSGYGRKAYWTIWYTHRAGLAEFEADRLRRSKDNL